MLIMRKLAFKHLDQRRPDRRWSNAIAVLAVCGLALGCDSPAEVLRLDEIRLDPATIQLNAGESVVLSAILTDQHGNSFPVPESDLTWRSGNSQVATVSGGAGGATVAGITGGSAVIRAASGGVAGSALIIVTPYVPPRPPPDVRIEVEHGLTNR